MQWFVDSSLLHTSPISKKDFLLHLKMICWWIQGLFELETGIWMGQTVGSPSRAWVLHSAARPDGLRTAGAPAARTTSASLFSQRPYSSGKAWGFRVFHQFCCRSWKLLEDHVKVPMNNDGFMVRRHVEILWIFFCEVSILSMRNYHFRVRKGPFHNFAGLERKLVSVAGPPGNFTVMWVFHNQVFVGRLARRGLSRWYCGRILEPSEVLIIANFVLVLQQLAA